MSVGSSAMLTNDAVIRASKAHLVLSKAMRWSFYLSDLKRPQFRLENRHIPWLVLIIMLLILGSHAHESPRQSAMRPTGFAVTLDTDRHLFAV